MLQHRRLSCMSYIQLLIHLSKSDLKFASNKLKIPLKLVWSWIFLTARTHFLFRSRTITPIHSLPHCSFSNLDWIACFHTSPTTLSTQKYIYEHTIKLLKRKKCCDRPIRAHKQNAKKKARDVKEDRIDRARTDVTN